MNCLTAVVARLLEAPLEQVPDLGGSIGFPAQFERLQTFLDSHGLRAHPVTRDFGGRLVGLAKLRSGSWHAVLVEDGQITFDPDGTKTTFEEVRRALLIRADPWIGY